ncbi:acyl-CoA/acyl-ACP dehydrogenase [bacterium]|nr:acyl-CoA/acyl-ACP dehydrogenase [bacterium]
MTQLSTPKKEQESFLETSLKLAGKTEEETRTTGALDRADEMVEKLFDRKYRTEASPVHRAVWDRYFPVDLFIPERQEPARDIKQAMDRSIEVVAKYRKVNSLFNEKGKIPESVYHELGDAGYWSMLVPREYGGLECPPTAFFPFVARMATIDATIAGLASIHGCVGCVDPIKTFGTNEQKKRYLPRLAKGRPLSGFALTEPNAGSDLTALRTKAYRDGDSYVLSGEKLFITNAYFGRSIGVVCMIDDTPSVLICDLPEKETDNFQFVHYGLYALRRGHNYGLRFNNFRVPKENRIVPPVGNGLLVAYHGLNLGRVALCSLASGGMRTMLASMIPWAKFRRTYGQSIIKRELVQSRIGRLAGRVMACDSIATWCAWLLEQGYRGEMECIVAKIFASESQKDAALELFMKTHGGRAFLHGHSFGDNVHEFLAPCIYEGEGEMLGMAFLKSLIKEHGQKFFEPIGRILHDQRISKPNMKNPAHLWALREPLKAYAGWQFLEKLHGSSVPFLPTLPEGTKEHVEWAIDKIQRSRLEISSAMTKFQLTLADRQCRINEISSRVRDLTTIIVTGLWSGRQKSEVNQLAGELMCEELATKLRGKRPSDRYLRRICELGDMVADGQFEALAGVPAEEIHMPYKQ